MPLGTYLAKLITSIWYKKGIKVRSESSWRHAFFVKFWHKLMISIHFDLLTYKGSRKCFTQQLTSIWAIKSSLPSISSYSKLGFWSPTESVSERRRSISSESEICRFRRFFISSSCLKEFIRKCSLTFSSNISKTNSLFWAVKNSIDWSDSSTAFAIAICNNDGSTFKNPVFDAACSLNFETTCKTFVRLVWRSYFSPLR